MKLDGRIWRDGKWWLIEVPALGAMTQGKTKAEAFEMIKDWVRNAVRQPAYVVTTEPLKDGAFFLSASDAAPLVALLLRRQRESQGVSLADAARRLGVKSKNAYARYERGDSVPTVDKLMQLLAAVNPGADVVMRIA